MMSLKQLGTAVALLSVVTLPCLAVAGSTTGDEEWVVAPPSQEEADAIAPAPSYGYLHESGELAISLDTAGVFCPDLAVMIVNPALESDVVDRFAATVISENLWEVADPDTGELVNVKVQRAAYTYDDGTTLAQQIIDEGGNSLAVVSVDRVALVRWPFYRFWRLRWFQICGEPLQSPWPWWPVNSCWSGYRYTFNGNGLQCRYQPWMFCFEWFRPTVTLTRYECRDCTGHILWQRQYGQYVCAWY